MDLGNPVITALVGLVIFYIGLKTFSGGMKSMGNMEHLAWFTGNIFYMFIGGIVMTLLWQSSSLSTTAIIALVASGAIPLPAAIKTATLFIIFKFRQYYQLFLHYNFLYQLLCYQIKMLFFQL